MKKKIVLATLLVASIILGIVLIFLVRTGGAAVKDITLKENGVTREDLEFSVSGLYPGVSREYTLNLRANSDAKYSIELEFTETKDGGLQNFIFVTVSCGDFSKEIPLSELFNGRKIDLECAVKSNAPTAILIKFKMPQEVGNEAAGTYCDFRVSLSAESK